MARKERHTATSITNAVVILPAAIFLMAMACGVVAFVGVRQSTSPPFLLLTRRPRSLDTPPLSMVERDADIDASGGDLKELLSTSDYSLDVLAANKGKVVKTAVPVTADTPAVPETTPVIDPPPSVDITVTTPFPETPPPTLSEPRAAVETMKVAVVQSKTSILPDGHSSPRSDLSDALSKPFMGLNSFLKSTQDSIKANQEAAGSTDSVKSAPKMVDYIAQKVVEKKAELGVVTENTATSSDTAKPLVLYLKDLISGDNPNTAGTSSAALAESKAKLDLLLQNLGGLAKDVLSQVPLEGGGASIAGGRSSKLWQDASKSLDQLPEGSKLWVAVGLVVLLTLGNGNQNDGAVSADRSALQSSSAKLEDLTDHLEAFQTRIKVIEANSITLSDDLKAANEKLMQKELEISKERLKALDVALTLNRQIDALQQKLKENDRKVQILDKELIDTKAECKILSAELIKAKKEQAPAAEAKGKAKVAKRAELKEIRAEKAKGATTMATVANMTASALSIYFTEPETLSSVKKEELPSATTAQPVKSKAKVMTKVQVEKTGAKEKAAPQAEAAIPAISKSGVAAENWASLSKSTLLRKTVKELQGYLDSKGITTTDFDGKPFKKAVLVEAVLAL